MALKHVSQFDFQHYTGVTANPVVEKIVPLNRTDSICVTIAQQKRYLVYNYL